MICVDDCSRAIVELMLSTATELAAGSEGPEDTLESPLPWIYNFSAANASFATIFAEVASICAIPPTHVLPYPQFFARLKDLAEKTDHPVRCLVDRFSKCCGCPPPPKGAPAADMDSVVRVLKKTSGELFPRLGTEELRMQLQWLGNHKY